MIITVCVVKIAANQQVCTKFLHIGECFFLRNQAYIAKFAIADKCISLFSIVQKIKTVISVSIDQQGDKQIIAKVSFQIGFQQYIHSIFLLSSVCDQFCSSKASAILSHA